MDAKEKTEVKMSETIPGVKNEITITDKNTITRDMDDDVSEVGEGKATESQWKIDQRIQKTMKCRFKKKHPKYCETFKPEIEQDFHLSLESKYADRGEKYLKQEKKCIEMELDLFRGYEKPASGETKDAGEKMMNTSIGFCSSLVSLLMGYALRSEGVANGWVFLLLAVFYILLIFVAVYTYGWYNSVNDARYRIHYNYEKQLEYEIEFLEKKIGGLEEEKEDKDGSNHTVI